MTTFVWDVEGAVLNAAKTYGLVEASVFIFHFERADTRHGLPHMTVIAPQEGFQCPCPVCRCARDKEYARSSQINLDISIIRGRRENDNAKALPVQL